ncbi:MAG: hypothetical protein SCK29_13795 [Bacillota bacterium]|nr:hypothetical protein [Bacillota bacterium]MDW7685176.1 hypothetical protein [Bacillota bacterium]
MFYYVDCPVCKKDLSEFVSPEKFEDEEPVFCIHCETKLRLRLTEQEDEEMGGLCGIFWFEKWDKE